MSNVKSQENQNFDFFESEDSLLDNQLQIYKEEDLTENFKNSLSYKQFIDEEEEGLEEEEKSRANFKLPKFLQSPSFNFNNKKPKKDDLEGSDAEEGVGEDYESENINSIGSIFSKDHEEVNGLRRVFKKSMSFLVIHLVLFLALCFSGLFLFRFNPLMTFSIAILYLVFSNIFFIIVADKSYVFLAVLGQSILLIFANAFFGLGFDPITLILTLIIILFTYLAYSELEKVQLSSRLFSISHITAESTRILLTSMILILSLGAFNGITSEGSGNFVERVFLDNEFIMENFVIDGRNRLSLNSYLMGGRFTTNANEEVKYYDRQQLIARNATYRDFLKENYRTADVLTQSEIDTIRAACTTGFNSPECDETVKNREDELLKVWDEEGFTTLRVNRGLDFKFEDELNKEGLKVLTKQLYQNQIRQFENVNPGENDLIPEWLLIVPLNSIIPAFFAIGVFFFLSLTKFIFVWITLFISWIVWNLFKLTGLVQIDIETVESEIVTI
jgi:hypothetical protein